MTDERGKCGGGRAMDERFLMIGQGDVFTAPTRVRTVLGSCVSVTFHCPQRGVGAMFHALLSRRCEFERCERNNAFRYVDSAIEETLKKLGRLGVTPAMIQCKIFGGANSLVREGFCSGRRNVEAAFETLERRHLQVVATSVGGERGRKLLFFPHLGDVYVKLLNSSLCPL
jgi:chemotaxis protein CheD